MEKTKRLTRVEIAFEEGAPTGAQCTVEEGYIIEGKWLKTGESTMGVDCGKHPEYADKIKKVLGDVTVKLQTENEGMNKKKVELEAELDNARVQLEEERTAYKNRKEQLLKILS